MSRLLLFVSAALLLVVLVGCDGDPGFQYTYTTRGIVINLPGDMAYEELMVHHEAIPDYVSLSGSIGMDSMTMPFPLKDISLLDGISIGDKIEITYGETLEPKFKSGVISITKLPAETELNFDKLPQD